MLSHLWGTVELVNIMHHGYPHRYLERMTKKTSEGLLWDQQILASFFGALFFKTWFCITWFWPWMCWCVFLQPYFLFVQVSSQATCVLLFHVFLVDPNFALAWQAWHGNSSLGCILRDLRGRFQKLLPPEFAHYSDRDFMHAVAWQLILMDFMEGVNLKILEMIWHDGMKWAAPNWCRNLFDGPYQIENQRGSESSNPWAVYMSMPFTRFTYTVF